MNNQKSKGHVQFSNDSEYFIWNNGELYRAPLHACMGTDGYRLGARWEAPAHMIKARLELINTPIQDVLL